ncbi:MAG TPA: OmpA family protein [Chitinispirillaceae bacterium]|jgi:peptidoglycan-associated lipoprotein|nr:OmpA family protein [Chitinispirillaceae bacterium]
MNKKRLCIILGFMLLAVITGGCRKQKSTLQDIPVQQPADSVFSDFKPFADVDTSDNAIFKEAQLADDLAIRAREALRPVYFEYNSYNLTSEAVEALTIAAKFLKDNPGMRVLIQGHCDERGSSEYNMGLGERRAKAVRDYMENYGVAPIRMEVTSMGKEQPVIPGCTNEECHSKNRRSEFVALAR